jgi:hypothetical protein
MRLYYLDKLPMLMYHGTDDDVIDCKVAKKGYELMIGQRENFKLNLIKGLSHSVDM